MSIFHDFIIVEQEKSTSILKTNTENVGIVKEIGSGYYSDNGNFVENIKDGNLGYLDLLGKRILFTQHIDFEVDGEKIMVVRGRDVIKVWN